MIDERRLLSVQLEHLGYAYQGCGKLQVVAWKNQVSLKSTRRALLCKLQHDSNAKLLTGSWTLMQILQRLSAGSACHTHLLPAVASRGSQMAAPGLDLGLTGPC